MMGDMCILGENLLLPSYMKVAMQRYYQIRKCYNGKGPCPKCKNPIEKLMETTKGTLLFCEYCGPIDFTPDERNIQRRREKREWL